MFLGDSLTAGYGVGKERAYPALIAQKIRAANLPFDVVNAGVSGDTSADGLRRIDWLLQQKIDILVIALGANDGLRGLTAERAGNKFAGDYRQSESEVSANSNRHRRNADAAKFRRGL